MVRCADCGYLAAKDEISKKLIELDPGVRKTGQYRDSIGNERQAVVFCYAGKRQFTDDELGACVRMVAAIDEGRECDAGFTPYRRGRDAKEHEEMTVIEAVRAQSARLDAELREERVHAQRDRDQAAKDRADSASREIGRDVVDKSRFRWSLLIPSVVAIAAAVFSVVLAEFVKH